jgi:hypothetical protein
MENHLLNPPVSNFPTVVCSVCQSTAAVVSVPASSFTSNSSYGNDRTTQGDQSRRSSCTVTENCTPLCLLHYYTTAAGRISRHDTNNHAVTSTTIMNQEELQIQLPQQQELFAEAYIQIQREIQEELMKLTSPSPYNNASNMNDPLSIIVDLNQQGHKKRRNVKILPNKERMLAPEGGFLRDIPVPERLQRVQEQQARQQTELITRMDQSASNTEVDLTQRRKSTRTSVWHVMSNDDRKPSAVTRATATTITYPDVADHITCTCGSHQVQTVSSNLNKSQDMSKAETWGNKDRQNEIVTRYICTACGKAWTEIE